MEELGWIGVMLVWMVGGGISFVVIRYLKYGYVLGALSVTLLAVIIAWLRPWNDFLEGALMLWLPLFFVHTLSFGLVDYHKDVHKPSRVFEVKLKVRGRTLVLENIRRGISVLASAGSGKTESVIYGLLQHFQKERFSGIIHDYKDFEITEMAYPLWKDKKVPFRVVSFGPLYHRVNPIAPKYLPDEESVHEVSRVLLENLMEHRGSDGNNTSRFFKDAAEGLISGLMAVKDRLPSILYFAPFDGPVPTIEHQKLDQFFTGERDLAGDGGCLYQWDGVGPADGRGAQYLGQRV